MSYIIIFYFVILMIAPKFGKFIAYVYGCNKFSASEKLIYNIVAVNPEEGQDWPAYLASLLKFNFIGFVFLFLVIYFQKYLPFYREDLVHLNLSAIFNIAASYVTATNWQSFIPEHSLTHTSQVIGLTVQSFLAPATSMSAAMALVRAFSNSNNSNIGNFYVDIVRSIIYILLPISFVAALIFIYNGVPQNFSNPLEISTLENQKQIIYMGPVASWESIKLFGTNGGGFFASGSAHPFENPNIYTNFLQNILMFLLPTSLIFAYGYMVKNNAHSISVFIALSIIFLCNSFIIFDNERHINDALITNTGILPEENLEGKEVRFNLGGDAVFTNIATTASVGANNTVLESYKPLSILIMMINMGYSGAIFGGAGSGLYTIIIYIILTNFISGLMIGRIPELHGNQIQKKEINYAMNSIFIMTITIQLFSAIAMILEMKNHPSGNEVEFTKIMYNYLSVASNNGSALGNFTNNIDFHNIFMGISMLTSRFLYLVPVMMIAGSISTKMKVQATSASIPISGVAFGIIFTFVIIMLGAITIFPALILGPILQHLLMIKGKFL